MMRQHFYNKTKGWLTTFLCLNLLVLCTVACSDDDDISYGPSFQSAAQQDAQGTFAGSFTRVQVGTTDTLQASGTFTIIATDTLNRARIAYASDDLAELEATAPFAANIAHADNGYMFFNKSGDIALLGRVETDGSMSASFTKAVRSGRKTVVL